MKLKNEIMRAITVGLFLFVMSISGHAGFKMGIVGTGALGLNFYQPYNIWPGLIVGGGLTGEFYIFKSAIMSFEPMVMYTYDAYRMVTDQSLYQDNNSEYIYPLAINHNIRYGGYLNLYLNKSYSYRMGLGFIASYTFAGKYGIPYQEEKYDLAMLGHDYYLSFKTGFLLSIDKLSGTGAISGGKSSYIPIELVVDYCITVRPAHLFNLRVQTGFVFDI